MKKKLKVLYVCTFAHYTGHFSWAAVHEPPALADTGVEIDLLTFCGVTDEKRVKVPQSTALQHSKLGVHVYNAANFFRKWGITVWLAMFLETYFTLSIAIRLKHERGYDIIHLRDGEPFLFLPFLLNIDQRNYKWLISVTGSNMVTLASQPSLFSAFKKSFRLFLYTIYMKILTTSLWRPVFRRSMARNRFILVTQNELASQAFESYAGGILAGNIFCLQLGVNDIDNIISRKDARRYFGLPADKPVFLSFGFLHAGKDMMPIFEALKDVPDAVLIHGGDQGFGLHLPSAIELMKQYNLGDRIMVKDHYIPEEEKPYFFFAADAVILSYTRQFLSTTSLLWQACRFGTPVIASDNGQLKELIEKYQPGLLFKAQDAESLRQAIIKFINLKTAEVKKMQENCRRFTSAFSMENWAKRCREIYARL